MGQDLGVPDPPPEPDSETGSSVPADLLSVQHRHRFRWWMPVVGVVVLALGALGVLLLLFLNREEPEALSVEEAMEEFRSSTATTSGEETGLRPPAGVYRMEGEGREEISFPPVHQDDGATMPATVEHSADGCWIFTVNYNEAHWQDWTLCPSDRGLEQPDSHTFQDWDFGATSVANLSTFECDPPAPFIVLDLEPGGSLPRECIGTNERVSGTSLARGTLTFVGTESLEIGGVEVEALRFRQHADLSGSQTGTEDVDFWFAVEDGMPLRGERSVEIGSDSPVGTITYTEEGHWQLASLEPER